MENNNENKRGFFLFKFSSRCLSVAAIVLSIISIVLSTFTLVNTNKVPRHNRRFSINNEMKNNQFDRNYNKGFNGFHYNKKPENFNPSFDNGTSNDQRPNFKSSRDQKGFIDKKDVGPSVAPEVSPNTQNNQP